MIGSVFFILLGVHLKNNAHEHTDIKFYPSVMVVFESLVSLQPTLTNAIFLVHIMFPSLNMRIFVMVPKKC